MRQVRCEACGNQVPLGESFRARERTYCRACAEVALKAGEIPRNAQGQPQIERLFDPTVCGQCGADGGSFEFGPLGGVPTCDPCAAKFRNRPFPVWLKISLLAMAALAVFVFARNLRFFQGHVEATRAGRAFQAGQVERAADLLEAAAAHVPECREFEDEALFVRSLVFLREDKDAEAVKLLTDLKRRTKAFKSADYYLLCAEQGVAFNNKDYDAFLAKSVALAALRPTRAQEEAGVASAYACKFAVTGDETFRRESLAHLEKARGLVKPDDKADFAEYEKRILHRLESREILTAKEYYQRFPRKEGEVSQ